MADCATAISICFAVPRGRRSRRPEHFTSVAPGGIVRPWSPARGGPCRTSRPGSAARPRSGASCRRTCWLARGTGPPAHVPAFLPLPGRSSSSSSRTGRHGQVPSASAGALARICPTSASAICRRPDAAASSRTWACGVGAAGGVCGGPHAAIYPDAIALTATELNPRHPRTIEQDPLANSPEPPRQHQP